MQYITRVLPKREVQNMIKAIRSSGLKVKKIDGGYICKAISHENKPIEIFKAMHGNNGYLVRMVDNLFA
jgi:hypothetical protein